MLNIFFVLEAWRVCKIKYKGQPTVHEELDQNIRNVGSLILAEYQRPNFAAEKHNPSQSLQEVSGLINFFGSSGEENQQKSTIFL